MPSPYYATGVLTEEHHERLVADLVGFAQDAGIQPHWIYTALGANFGPGEVDYIRRFRQHMNEGKLAGVCYTGATNAFAMEQHLAAFAGCLVRNFVRARVMTLGAVIEAAASRSMPDLSCVLIPNFFMSATDVGSIAKWQLQAVYDVLLERQAQGKQTVLYVSNPTMLAKEYGLAFTRLIDEHYLKVAL